MTNIQKFITYRFVSRLYFHLPFLYPIFLQINSGDIFKTAILFSTYMASSVLCSEFLQPNLNSRLSLKNNIALGELLKASGLAMLAASLYSSNDEVLFLFAVSAQVLGGLGFSLALASDNTLLASLTNQGLLNSSIEEVQSKSQSSMFIATLCSGVVGGMLFYINHTLPLVFGALASLTSILLIYFIDIIEPSQINDMKTTKKSLKHLKAFFYTNYYHIFTYIFLRTFIVSCFVFILPASFIYFSYPQHYFGLFIGIFTLSGFISSNFYYLLNDFSHKTKKNISFALLFVSIIIILINVLSHSSINILITCMSIMFLGFASGLSRNVSLSNLVFHSIPKAEVATFFSKIEGINGLLTALILLITGYLTYYQNLLSAVTIFCSIATLLLLAFERFNALLKKANIRNGNF